MKTTTCLDCGAPAPGAPKLNGWATIRGALLCPRCGAARGFKCTITLEMTVGSDGLWVVRANGGGIVAKHPFSSSFGHEDAAVAVRGAMKSVARTVILQARIKGMAIDQARAKAPRGKPSKCPRGRFSPGEVPCTVCDGTDIVCCENEVTRG